MASFRLESALVAASGPKAKPRHADPSSVGGPHAKGRCCPSFGADGHRARVTPDPISNSETPTRFLLLLSLCVLFYCDEVV